MVQRVDDVNGYGGTPPQRMAVHGRSWVRYPFCRQTLCVRAPSQRVRSCPAGHRNQAPGLHQRGPGHGVDRGSSQPRLPAAARTALAGRVRRRGAQGRAGDRRAGRAATPATSGAWSPARSAVPTTRTNGSSCTCSPGRPWRTWASRRARPYAAGRRRTTGNAPDRPDAPDTPPPPTLQSDTDEESDVLRRAFMTSGTTTMAAASLGLGLGPDHRRRGRCPSNGGSARPR